MDTDDFAAEASRRAPVTDRVNVEPPILQGMTASEAKVVGLAALALCLVLSGILWAVSGVWQVVLVLGTFGPVAIIWIAAGRLASLKRGRPDGHYNQVMHLWLADRGRTQLRIVRHHGQWSLGRSFGADLSSPLDPRKFAPPGRR